MLYEAIRIFIFVQSIQLVFSLNSAEICINSSPCEEIHNFQCIKDICSVNKKTCDDYLVFKSILSQYFFKSLLVNFESNIQTCDSFKLTKNDYCLNNSNCLKKINFQWHFGFRTIKLKQECKCEVQLTIRNKGCAVTSRFSDEVVLVMVESGANS